MRLALFQPDIPQNLGAALRLCACLGVPLDVVEPTGFPFNDKSIKRSALDYGPLADVTRHASFDDFLAAPERKLGRLALFTTKAARPFQDFDYRTGDTLIFGKESAGAPDYVHDAADARLIIPLAPGARSFNLVNSAAMALSLALNATNAFPTQKLGL